MQMVISYNHVCENPRPCHCIKFSSSLNQIDYMLEVWLRGYMYLDHMYGYISF